MINLLLTTKCNFRCKHCMFSCTNSGEDCSSEIVEDVICLANKLGVGVNIIGGEPTLHPDFCEILVHLARRVCGTRLVTNGSRLRQVILSNFA